MVEALLTLLRLGQLYRLQGQLLWLPGLVPELLPWFDKIDDVSVVEHGADFVFVEHVLVEHVLGEH